MEGARMPARERLLELALKGLEVERARLDGEINEIRLQISGRPNGRVAEIGMPSSVPGRKRRRMSAAARRKISEAMKRRHAATRIAMGQRVQQSKPARPGLTPAGRKKLSEMMKARWAAKRKAAAKK